MDALMTHTRNRGFQTPNLIRSQSGNLVSQGWTLETFIEGRPWPTAKMPALKKPVIALHASSHRFLSRPGFAGSLEARRDAVAGTVCLADLPADVAALCLSAWEKIAEDRQIAVHGDLNPENVIQSPDGRPALIDWDECRMDAPLYDLLPLCDQDQVSPAWQAAHLAWETASGWDIEPAHAAKSLARLKEMLGRG